MSEKLANPAPLGLLGFGLTTVLLNLHNAGLFPLDTMILAMGLAYGGLAQVIVGVMEYKKGNTFGTVAFTSYGLFWWSLVLLLVLPKTLLHVGTFHVLNVLWNAEEKPCTAVCVHEFGDSVLPVDDKRFDG
jgi:succinate-acetate transporter protein